MEGENEGEGVSRVTVCFLLGSEYTHAGRVHIKMHTVGILIHMNVA